MNELQIPNVGEAVGIIVSSVQPFTHNIKTRKMANKNGNL